jgi:hypothetical protein
MTKMEAYKFCQNHGAAFVANVVLTQHAEPAKKLKAIAKLLAAGHTVSLAQFSIDRLVIDGYEAPWSKLSECVEWRDRMNELRREWRDQISDLKLAKKQQTNGVRNAE